MESLQNPSHQNPPKIFVLKFVAAAGCSKVGYKYHDNITFWILK
jgi:hypothetical protein